MSYLGRPDKREWDDEESGRGGCLPWLVGALFLAAILALCWWAITPLNNNADQLIQSHAGVTVGNIPVAVYVPTTTSAAPTTTRPPTTTTAAPAVAPADPNTPWPQAQAQWGCYPRTKARQIICPSPPTTTAQATTAAYEGVSSTAYCSGGTTANGGQTYQGGVAMNNVPFGSQWQVQETGAVYTVNDRIGSGSDFDIYFNSCDTANNYGRQFIHIRRIG